MHGLRVSFRTWAAEAIDYPREIAEAALGHLVGDDIGREHARTTFFDRRRTLPEEQAKSTVDRPRADFAKHTNLI